MRKLLIATWGSPVFWKSLNYVVDGGQERFVKSCTTLVPMARDVCVGNCDVVVIVLDSLVDLGEPREKNECSECCEKHGAILSGEWKTYKELREAVERFLKEVVKCVFDFSETRLEGKEYFIIAPAIGRPGGTWRFHGSPKDYESIVLYELGKIVLSEKYDEILLDLTHGINFMPSVTLKVAYRLASILLVAHTNLSQVKLKVYNSDPFNPSKKAEEVAALKINVVIEDSVQNIQIIHDLPDYVLRIWNKEVSNNSLISQLKKLRKVFYRNVGLVYSTLYYPLPLALIAAVEKLRRADVKPFKIMEEAYDLWLNTIRVKDRVVERPLSLNPDAVYLSHLTEAVVKRLQDFKYPSSLGQLEKIAKLYEAVNHSYPHLIKHEISELKSRSKEKTITQWTSYSKLLGGGIGEKGSVDKPDKRIMIAHAGFQKEFVEIGPELLTKYSSDVDTLLRKSGLRLKRKNK